jgi:flagellar basal-body rod modification protein FlgD
MSPTTNATSNPVTTGSASSTAGTTPSNDPLANESTFLTLLVSQLQYQDPLNPVDSTQFMTQLTGYSQLEQLIGIHQNTTTLAGAATTTTTPTSGTSSDSGANQSPTGTTGG